ncbi:pinin/SDK/memA/ protein conserved region-domain-containing protein [Cladochytrium replicatum]|nr:pinin/SDK/memA/ protein conserved region-domain-containing protein [Cladochytrium replicatum]
MADVAILPPQPERNRDSLKTDNDHEVKKDVLSTSNGAENQQLSKEGILEESYSLKRPRPDVNADAELKKRSKRMFGVLLGTLSEFKQASTQKSEKDLRREQIILKTQEKMQKDREELAAKVQQEQEERRKHFQEERQRLEQERAIYTKNALQAQHEYFSRFIKTTSGPPIYYLPVKHNEKTAALLVESREKTTAAAAAIAEAAAAALAAVGDDVPKVPAESNTISRVDTPSRLDDPMSTNDDETEREKAKQEAEDRRGRGDETPDRMDEDGKGDERPGNSKDEDEVHW